MAWDAITILGIVSIWVALVYMYLKKFNDDD